MAVGDDALAAGMQVVDGATTLASDNDLEHNRTRDYIAQRTSTVNPVAKGGTGATNAATARTNLDVPSNADLATRVINSSSSTNAIQLRWELGRVVAKIDATDQGQIAYVTDVNGAAGQRVAKTGDTMSGDLYVPNSTAANSSYTIAYINGDGRLSRGASSERYKKNISELDPASFGELFPGIFRYKMRSGSSASSSDGVWHYGWIAEKLAESDELRPFVVFDPEGQPESIDFVALLIVQTANLHHRLTTIERTVAA